MVYVLIDSSTMLNMTKLKLNKNNYEQKIEINFVPGIGGDHAGIGTKSVCADMLY